MEKSTLLYLEGYTLTRIRKDLKTSSETINKNLIKDGILRRSHSECMILFYKNNPNKHPWKNNNKFLSKPCENFKLILSQSSIKFIEEYSEFADHCYSIDVALPEYKIGFEINGNQHYNKDGSLREYYQKRSDYIEGLGWKLYQIHYTLCFDKTVVVECVKNSISQASSVFNFNYEKYLFDKLNKKPKIYDPKISTCSCGKKILRVNKQCKNCFDLRQRKVLNRPTKHQLLKEVSEIGYLATGKKYGVADNTIRKWIRISK
jgi:hypothetical protein